MSDTILTWLQILAIPITGYLVSVYMKRQDNKSGQEIARINSVAEMQEANINLLKNAENMLAPMTKQLSTVTQENLTLQNLIEQLRADNKNLQLEQSRLNQVEASQRKKINEQAAEIDNLKARIASLEKIDLQRKEEIKAVKEENDRLRGKVDRITNALDTGQLSSGKKDK